MSETPDLTEALEEERPEDHFVPSDEKPTPEPQRSPVISRVDVLCCPLCRMEHLAIDVKEYQLPHPSFTHYYWCPIADAPLGVLATVDRGPVIDHGLLETIRKMVMTNRWMFIGFFCEEGQPVVTKTWVTNRFPNVVFDEAMKWTSDDFHAKTDGPMQIALAEVEVNDEVPPLFAQAAGDVS